MIELTNPETDCTVFVDENSISAITIPEKLMGGPEPEGSVIVLSSGATVTVSEDPKEVHRKMMEKDVDLLRSLGFANV